MDDATVTFITTPDRETAERLAEHLVGARLAACVNIIPGVTSVYRWEGAVQKDDEVLMVVKSRPERWGEIEEAMEKEHPYDVPAVVHLSIADGSAKYLEWLVAESR